MTVAAGWRARLTNTGGLLGRGARKCTPGRVRCGKAPAQSWSGAGGEPTIRGAATAGLPASSVRSVEGEGAAGTSIPGSALSRNSVSRSPPSGLLSSRTGTPPSIRQLQGDGHPRARDHHVSQPPVFRPPPGAAPTRCRCGVFYGDGNPARSACEPLPNPVPEALVRQDRDVPAVHLGANALGHDEGADGIGSRAGADHPGGGCHGRVVVLVAQPLATWPGRRRLCSASFTPHARPPSRSQEPWR